MLDTFPCSLIFAPALMGGGGLIDNDIQNFVKNFTTL
jgi:hypothetical protein